MALGFPEMFFKNSTKVLDGAEGTKNNLSLMLKCEKGEQLGDPDFGVNLHKAKFQSNSSLGQELAIDGILDSQNFVGNVLFFRDDVQVKKVSAGKIDITINAIFSTSINQRELLVVQGVDLE